MSVRLWHVLSSQRFLLACSKKNGGGHRMCSSTVSHGNTLHNEGEQPVSPPPSTSEAERGASTPAEGIRFTFASSGNEGGEQPATTPTDRRSQFALTVDPTVQAAVAAGQYTANRHPGKRTVKASELPEQVTKAFDIILEGRKKSEFVPDINTLLRMVWERHGPLEDADKKEKMRNIMHTIVNNEQVDPLHPAVQEVDRRSLLKQRDELLNLRMQAAVGQYSPIDFTDKHNCLVYLMARASPDYSALVKVLNQLRLAQPEFTPTTFLDFGSGVGTVSWAVDRVWPKMCSESFSVDASAEMNTINERIHKGGNLEDPFLRRSNSTFFRQFLPASGSIKHNLVISSRTLFELPDRETRLRILDILWRTVAPGGCIVIVEAGNRRGCKMVLEARHFLLEGVDASKSINRGKVIAPCPHQFECPLNKKQAKYRICSDSTKYFSFISTDAQLDIFAYIIIQKPSPYIETESSSKEASGASNCGGCGGHWPRVVQPVLRPSGQSIVRVCNAFGNLQELAVTRGKHGLLGYRLGKATELGDLLPVNLLPPEQHDAPTDVSFKKTTEKKRNALLESSSDTDVQVKPRKL